MSEGNKIPKVEITISVDGVAIQDPKSKVFLSCLFYTKLSVILTFYKILSILMNKEK